MVSKVLEIGGGLLAFGIASEILFQIYLWWKGKHQERKPAIITDVLFFPDKQVACFDFFNKPNGCSNNHCRFAHKKNSLSKLYQYLGSAKKCLDICVYTICCKELCDIVILHYKRGITVRVLTDYDQLNVSGAQVWRLRKEGVPVRTGNPSFFMHHKFVIIDNEILLNGSFNWTRNAITGNQENILITNSSEVLTKYKEEFDKLWGNFNPLNIHKSELHEVEKINPFSTEFVSEK